MNKTPGRDEKKAGYLGFVAKRRWRRGDQDGRNKDVVENKRGEKEENHTVSSSDPRHNCNPRCDSYTN